MTTIPVQAETMIRVATLAELEEKGVVVVRGADRPVAVFFHEGKVFAIDNRCPHLGFPMHRGTVKDGIVTCHWHEARFDLCSGCTFDLWADDVPAFEVELRHGDVYVARRPRQAPTPQYFQQRLEEGMRQNISLIQAKAVVGLLHGGAAMGDIVRPAALFGVANRDAWSGGMTVLTAMANLAAQLDADTAYYALLQGTRRVAADCAGQPPRRPRQPLRGTDVPLETLKRWLRYWTLVRHRDGAERTLLTAIHIGASPQDLADLIFTAATDRFYADTGHLLDFANKAFELLDLIGWEHAERVLPAIVPPLVSARGGEESNAWRHPVDLVPLVGAAAEQIGDWMRQGGGGGPWDDAVGLAEAILGDDPHAILTALRDAVCAGATPVQLTQSLAYAASLRIVRFGTANELPDWITALHTFTYCNALHHAVGRCATPQVMRGLLHGAMSVYLDRFLNIPPAKMPDRLDDESTDADTLRHRLLDLLDGRHRISGAARVIARYVRLGHPVDKLIDTFTFAAAREDVDFHTVQMLEAGVAQYRLWRGTEQGECILIAIGRYLAAHSPTQRRLMQTATIALRLHRGENIYEDDSSS